MIAHEVGQWSAYPDYDVMKKFTGYMRPFNYEIFRDSLKAHGLLEKNKDFVYQSGRFQLAAYKEEIEANLRTPGLSGFQLLDLHDYLGQGTSFVGLLDAFWEPKSYMREEEFKKFRQFSNATVPLARFRQLVFTTADTLDVDVEIAHYGAEPIERALTVWKINNRVKGEWKPRTIPIGKNISLGKITADLSKFGAAGDYKLTVTVAPESFFSSVSREIVPGPKVIRGVTYFENEWNFWVYPASDPEEHAARELAATGAPVECVPARDPDVFITSSWDEAEPKLAAGKRVLFIARSRDLGWTSPPLDSVPIFWNRLMTPSWGRMLGLWIGGKEAVVGKSHTLDGFPTASHFDRQWDEIIQNVRAVNLDNLPAELEPAVWAIDDWNRNYKLGVIFELAIGDGRLLISAFDVSNPASPNPVLRQLRYALLRYAHSDCFQPQVSVSPEQVQSLFFDTQVMKKLGAVAQVEGASANAVIDGDPNTFIVVGDQDDPMREQVDLTITLSGPATMSGVVLMSRQSHREHEGDIRGYVLQVSDDGREWREVARGELLSTFAPQQIDFSNTVTARYLKLIALSGFGDDKRTALAELAIILDRGSKKSKPKRPPPRPKP